MVALRRPKPPLRQGREAICQDQSDNRPPTKDSKVDRIKQLQMLETDRMWFGARHKEQKLLRKGKARTQTEGLGLRVLDSEEMIKRDLDFFHSLLKHRVT